MSEFPKRMWSPAGKPTTAATAEAEAVLSAEGYTVEPAAQYPKLLWSPKGQEITVQTKDEEAEKKSEGYVDYAPNTPEADRPGAIRVLPESATALEPEQEPKKKKGH